MTRKELEELGLTKEQMDSVMKINGADIEKAKGDLKNVQAELEQINKLVEERDKQLEDLKKTSGDNAELKKQIETLQQQNADQKKAHDAEMTQLKLDNAMDAALMAAGAKNAKAVKALLDTSKVKLGEDGKLSGWNDQLNAIQKSDAYLFEAEQSVKQNFKGYQPGATDNTKPGGEIDTSKMTYSELAKYMADNPEVTIN